MKNSTLFIVLAIFITTINTSCKKNTVSTTGNCPDTDSLYLFLSSSIIEDNGFDDVTLTVKDKNGKDITSSCSFLLNNSTAITSPFTPTATGSYSIQASSKNGCSIPSQVKTLTMTGKSNSPFAQKILLEDCTGAWCGFCPRVANALDNYKLNHPNCISTAIHGGSGSDPYKYQYYSTLMNHFNASGYPSVLFNRKKQADNTYEWSESTADLNAALLASAPLGLSISSTSTSTTVSGTVGVKFNISTSKPFKIVVALVENGLVYPQTNYYSPGGYTPYLYGGADPVTDFVHNGVFRKCATDIYGDSIPAHTALKNNVWDFPFSINLTGKTSSGSSYTAIAANCGIVAFVVDGATNSPKGVLNVQYAPVGVVKNFD